MLSLEKGMGQGVIQIGPDKSETISDIAKKLLKISGKEKLPNNPILKILGIKSFMMVFMRKHY